MGKSSISVHCGKLKTLYTAKPYNPNHEPTGLELVETKGSTKKLSQVAELRDSQNAQAESTEAPELGGYQGEQLEHAKAVSPIQNHREARAALR